MPNQYHSIFVIFLVLLISTYLKQFIDNARLKKYANKAEQKFLNESVGSYQAAETIFEDRSTKQPSSLETSGTGNEWSFDSPLSFSPQFSEVVVYPNVDGQSSDMGGVSSVCEMMHNLTLSGRNVTKVAINHSDWLCEWGVIGNKMGMYLQARSLAWYQDIEFEISPQCETTDHLITWMPQSFSPAAGNHTRDISGTWGTSNHVLSDPCICPGQPIAHQCVDGWPLLARQWHTEIREALTKWSLSTGKPPMRKGTATIHVRCGDIVDPLVIKTGGGGWYGFNKASFYAKHFNATVITAIDIVTTSIHRCSAFRLERYSDCRRWRDCSQILNALVQELSTATGLPKKAIRVHDKVSTMWTMHHIVFSDLTFCSAGSTFCFFSSLGSNFVIHPKPSSIPLPALNILSDLLTGFELDAEEESVLWMKDLVLGEDSTSHDVANQVIAWITNRGQNQGQR